MVKIVIDTNLLLKKVADDKSQVMEIIERCLAGKYQPTVSRRILKKTVEVLGKLDLSPESQEKLEDFFAVCEVIPADFNLEIIKLMLENIESHELHDEIIAMTCKKYNTNIIYSTDDKLKEIFKLQLRSWK